MGVDTEEILELVKENHAMLRKMRRSMRIGSFFTFLYWTLVIGSLVGAYYYLRPFIDVGRQNVNSIQATIEQIRGAAGSLPSNLDIGSILEQFKKGQ